MGAQDGDRHCDVAVRLCVHPVLGIGAGRPLGSHARSVAYRGDWTGARGSAGSARLRLRPPPPPLPSRAKRARASRALRLLRPHLPRRRRRRRRSPSLWCNWTRTTPPTCLPSPARHRQCLCLCLCRYWRRLLRWALARHAHSRPRGLRWSSPSRAPQVPRGPPTRPPRRAPPRPPPRSHASYQYVVEGRPVHRARSTLTPGASTLSFFFSLLSLSHTHTHTHTLSLIGCLWGGGGERSRPYLRW
jgi:hypothetical protein